MPKREIIHSAGNPLEPELTDIIEKLLGRDAVIKLERFGGKISISVTAPFSNNKERAKNNIVIDEKFIDELRILRDKPNDLKQRMSILSAKKLREISRMIGHPVRTKSTREEIMEELISFFNSDEIWKRIAG